MKNPNNLSMADLTHYTQLYEGFNSLEDVLEEALNISEDKLQGEYLVELQALKEKVFKSAQAVFNTVNYKDKSR